MEVGLDERVEVPGIWLPLSALAEGIRGLWSAYALEPLTDPTNDGLAADHQIVPVPLEMVHQVGDRVFVRGPVPDASPRDSVEVWRRISEA